MRHRLRLVLFLLVAFLAVPYGVAQADNPHDGGNANANGNGNGNANGLQDNGPGNGNGGTQGNSESNPDGGGVDKPYDAAGQPAQSQGPDYFDGNNGCGQDKHSGEAPDPQGGFDDNNGNCGNPHKGGENPPSGPPPGPPSNPPGPPSNPPGRPNDPGSPPSLEQGAPAALTQTGLVATTTVAGVTSEGGVMEIKALPRTGEGDQGSGFVFGPELLAGIALAAAGLTVGATSRRGQA
jgi:hypothetical protein